MTIEANREIDSASYKVPNPVTEHVGQSSCTTVFVIWERNRDLWSNLS